MESLNKASQILQNLYLMLGSVRAIVATQPLLEEHKLQSCTQQFFHQFNNVQATV